MNLCRLYRARDSLALLGEWLVALIFNMVYIEGDSLAPLVSVVLPRLSPCVASVRHHFGDDVDPVNVLFNVHWLPRVSVSNG